MPKKHGEVYVDFILVLQCTKTVNYSTKRLSALDTNLEILFLTSAITVYRFCGTVYMCDDTYANMFQFQCTCALVRHGFF